MKYKIVLFFLIFSNCLYSQNKFQGKISYTIQVTNVDFSKIENDSTKSVEVKNIKL